MRRNAALSRVEQIKKLHRVEDEWMLAGKELTPTPEPKGKPMGDRHAGKIEALYGE